MDSRAAAEKVFLNAVLVGTNVVFGRADSESKSKENNDS